jgi:hypothetical protein
MPLSESKAIVDAQATTFLPGPERDARRTAHADRVRGAARLKFSWLRSADVRCCGVTESWHREPWQLHAASLDDSAERCPVSTRGKQAEKGAMRKPIMNTILSVLLESAEGTKACACALCCPARCVTRLPTPGWGQRTRRALHRVQSGPGPFAAEKARCAARAHPDERHRWRAPCFRRSDSSGAAPPARGGRA